MENNPRISVVTPVYGCNACLHELVKRLQSTFDEMSVTFEIIMVFDCSKDGAWETIEELAAADSRVKGIHLSRNFGQHYAISAGLDYTKGDYVVVMDCDLQDQPEEIPKLYTKALEGYEIVFGRRYERHDRFLKRMGSKLFYKIFDSLTDGHTDHTIANFSICSKQVVEQLRLLNEHDRFYPLMLKWAGFRAISVDIEHAKRTEGTSSYSLKKLIRLAMNTIIAQSNKPLYLSIKFGFLIAFLSLVYGAYLMYKYFFLGHAVQGWTSTIVSLYFIGGLIIANLGIIGLYIGKMFDEVKKRPLYIVRKTVGFEEGKGRKHNVI